MKLAGKIALVTGGSRGIGRATALAFAAEGADVAFCHLNDDAKADETASEIRALGRRALHRSVDVADVAAGRAFAAAGARRGGRRCPAGRLPPMPRRGGPPPRGRRESWGRSTSCSTMPA